MVGLDGGRGKAMQRRILMKKKGNTALCQWLHHDGMEERERERGKARISFPFLLGWVVMEVLFLLKYFISLPF